MNKYKFLTSFFILLITVKCSSQEINCNQKVYRSSLKIKIPKSVCIPENYHIREILSQKDINNDSLKDFVFTYSKLKINDTDTLFVGVYTQKRDSTYIFKKKSGNLYPMFLEDYDSDIYINKSDETKELFSYSGNYPLNKLEFLENEIVIDFGIGEGETMELHFVYRKKESNWFLEWGIYESKLTKTEEEILGEKNNFISSKEKKYYEKSEQISIDEFNYFDWL